MSINKGIKKIKKPDKRKTHLSGRLGYVMIVLCIITFKGESIIPFNLQENYPATLPELALQVDYCFKH